MENIFIVLAIIASVIYKFYENYKKEMEEAAKRQQKARRVPPPVADGIPHTRSERPTPSRPNPQVPPPRPAIPAPEIRQPTVRERVSPTDTVRTEPLIPHDTVQTRSTHQRTESEKLKALELVVDEEDEQHAIDVEDVKFDLKRAVIQSAILDRPYRQAIS